MMAMGLRPSHGAVWMQYTLCLNVCIPSLFWSVKHSKMMASTIHDNRGLKLISTPRHPKQTSRRDALGAAPILFIRRARYVSQIIPLVVRSVAVDVVDLLLRPFVQHPKECKAVGVMMAPTNTNIDVRATARSSGNATNWPYWRQLSSPSKDARLWIIVEQLAQLLCGKIVASHEAPRLLNGQKPADICRVVRASSFYAICRTNLDRLTEARDWYTDLRERVNPKE